MSPLPDVNRLVRIDGRLLRVMGHVQSRLLLVHVDPPHGVYLCSDETGQILLPGEPEWSTLVGEGRAVECRPSPAFRLDDGEIQKVAFECGLLDAAGVRNGVKAISIWLHRNWTAEHSERFGPHSNPHTLRRWRAAKAF